jgi:hypothetical protein
MKWWQRIHWWLSWEMWLWTHPPEDKDEVARWARRRTGFFLAMYFVVFPAGLFALLCVIAWISWMFDL